MNDGNMPKLDGIVDRAKAIILNPSDTWPVLAAEQSTPGKIFARYALPLAAIGPVADFIGGQLFGISLFLATYRPSLAGGLTNALTSFVMSLISLVVVALIADFLAPNFGGEANRTQAFKLVAASMTPVWVAGILNIVPALGALGIIAVLYGIFLLYKGSTALMKVPEDKAVGFTALTVIAPIILYFIAASITTRTNGMMGMEHGGMMGSSGVAGAMGARAI